MVAGRLADRLGLGTTILAAMIGACSVYLVIPVLDASILLVAGVLGLVLAVAGALISVRVVHVMTIRQTVTPDRLLARMNASYRTLGYGLMSVGALIGGIIGGALGLRAALAVGAIGIACAPLWVVFSTAPRIRRLDDIAPARAVEARSEVVAGDGARRPMGMGPDARRGEPLPVRLEAS
jgi:predicted MFS family arabinose efflux permease